jgi:integrase
MVFYLDPQELKPGLIIFHRSDVEHKDWYCRVRIPQSDKYKFISLKTSDINEAREKAFDADADIRFRVKHEVPVFEKSFAEVAEEYGAYKKQMAEAGQITMKRWKTVDGHIRLHLIPYMGNIQITHIRQDKWDGYPLWRKQNGRSLEGKAKDGSIRAEMVTLRAIMDYAANRQYIRERQVPKGKLLLDKGRRDAFTPTEYRHLHTYARQWIKEGKTDLSILSRTMAYNFILVMANTGMRPGEARNLKWKDIQPRTDRQGRSFVALNVRGKGKFRELVATDKVAAYLERIKTISRATKPEDAVFSTHEGNQSSNLYDTMIEDLLTASGLLRGASGTRRSSYCFRHTYATFRLMEGVDVYFLAKQMGTSVKMIEDYYGHITPAENAERILQGTPGWEPLAEVSGETAASVNAGADGKKRKDPRETRED